MNLSGKLIIVGITGGIAAYKAPQIVRLLKKSGAEVKVIMTENAKSFITPLTMQAISGNVVLSSTLSPASNSGIEHIELAEKADAMIIASATANTIAKLRIGLADNLLTAVVLATKAPIFIAPAMNINMWKNVATQENIDILKTRGFNILGPNSGFQACGAIGEGRMSEPEEIFNLFCNTLTSLNNTSDNFLAGKKIVITAGPTEEPLDPVRFISNKSSGKMGYSLASEAKRHGASVTLISGPVHIPQPEGIKIIKVRTAEEMLNSVQDEIKACDIFISCAAVADYRAATIETQKIKKQSDTNQIAINFIKNPDILATIGHASNRPKIVIGFAAETQNLEQNALKKLASKGADFIIANDVSSSTIGFNSDFNSVVIFGKNGFKTTIPKMTKNQLSSKILENCKLLIS